MKRLLLLLLLASPALAADPKHERGLKLPAPEVLAANHAAALKRHGGRMVTLPQALPPAYDGRQFGWVPPIRDQADCGSCYLVSMCDVVSMAYIRAGYGKNDGTFSISSQYGMDCHDFGGCDGGWPAEVVDWIKKNGFPADADPSQDKAKLYPPYIAAPRQCRLASGSTLYKVVDWGYADAAQKGATPTVQEMKNAIAAYGPISIAIDAGRFDGYTSGVLTVTTKDLTHAVDIIGWDDVKQAYLVRNQWSTSWGEAGYMWLGYKSYFAEAIWASVTALPPPPPPELVTVPAVVGLPLQAATVKLSAASLVTSHVGDGPTVASQVPAAGASVLTGSTVALTMAATPPAPSPIFTLTFNKQIPKGGLVWFAAPAAIPTGAKLGVFPPGVPLSGLGDPPFEEQSAKPMPGAYQIQYRDGSPASNKLYPTYAAAAERAKWLAGVMGERVDVVSAK